MSDVEQQFSVLLYIFNHTAVILLPPHRKHFNVSRNTTTVMEFEEIVSNFALNDGKILSLTVNYFEQTCAVKLKVRRHLKKQQFHESIIDLLFVDVFSIEISEDFRTGADYSDITITKTADEKFYLSLDPYANTGEPDERDNFVIKSTALVITSENGEEF